MTDTLSTTQMQHALETLCDTIEDEKAYLSELDGAIGDGDHGVNMAKCFREVKKKLMEGPAEDMKTLFNNVGMVVLNSVGGAMGALYGTFFLKMAQEGGEKRDLALDDLVRMFQAAEKGILEIGKAKPGDKTLVDTLSPALKKAGRRVRAFPRPWRIWSRPPRREWNLHGRWKPKWAVPVGWGKERSDTRMRGLPPAILF